MPIIVLNFEIKVNTFTTKLQCAIYKVRYKVNNSYDDHGFNAGSKNRTASKWFQINLVKLIFDYY